MYVYMSTLHHQEHKRNTYTSNNICSVKISPEDEQKGIKAFSHFPHYGFHMVGLQCNGMESCEDFKEV